MANAAQLDAVRTKLQAALDGLALVQADAPLPGVGPLDNLAPGFAIDLGPWADPDPEFNGAGLSTLMMIEDSELIYDAPRKRVLLVGGGHGLSQQFVIRAMDLTGPNAGKWYNCSPRTPVADVTFDNIAIPGGYYKTTNCPTARHTYRWGRVIGDTYYCLQARGMADTANDMAAGKPHAGGQWGGSLCSFSFTTGKWTFSQKWFSRQGMVPPTTPLPAGGAEVPWYFAGQSYYDPRIDKIVVVGPGGYSGSNSAVWYYDYKNDDITKGPAISLPGCTPGAGDLVFVPELGKAFLFQNTYGTPSPYKVFAVTIDQTNLQNVTVVPVAVSGTPPCGNWSYANAVAYDSANTVIAGFQQYGVMFGFDPFTSTWAQMVMQGTPQGSAGAGLGSAHHCSAFDPTSGAVIFLEQRTGVRNTTWAVKWSKAAAVVNAAAKPITINGAASYATLFDIALIAKSGDTIAIAPGVYYGQAVDLSTLNNVTVQCSVPGQRARFIGGVASYKATFVVGSNWTFDGIECLGARGSQGNEAGIRMQGEGLTFRNGYAADCNDGILTNPNTLGVGDVLIDGSLIEKCGDGSGQSHNLYIGKHASFTFKNSKSLDANVGHCLKSRCAVTNVVDSQIYEGHASRAIDVPEGGVLNITSSAPGKTWIKQDNLTNNASEIGYAMETKGVPTWPVNEIHIDANTIVFNSRFGGVSLQTLAGFPLTVIDNKAQTGPDPAP